VAFLANVGQVEDWKAVEEKALKIGAQKMIIEGMPFSFGSVVMVTNGQ
jgi:argininosuccinate synthase